MHDHGNTEVFYILAHSLPSAPRLLSLQNYLKEADSWDRKTHNDSHSQGRSVLPNISGPTKRN